MALDMVEEFRQPVADRFVLQMFNGGVYLTEDGFRKFCLEYEKWMSGKNSASGEKSFRGCIRKQVSMLKKAICENKVYYPYSWEKARCTSDTDSRAEACM